MAAGAAVRAVPGLLRQRVEIRGGHDGLAEHLSEVLGTRVSFSISIGTARVNRKPVLQVFDEDGPTYTDGGRRSLADIATARENARAAVDAIAAVAAAAAASTGDDVVTPPPGAVERAPTSSDSIDLSSLGSDSHQPGSGADDAVTPT